MSKILNFLAVVLFLLSLTCTVFFYSLVRERETLINHLITETFPNARCAEVDRAVLALSGEIYRLTDNVIESSELGLYSRVESFSFFNVTTAVSLNYSAYGIRGHPQLGPCGTMSRVLLNTLWELGIPARKLYLKRRDDAPGGVHTLVEFMYKGKWRVISPSDSSFVWRSADGSIATAREIRDNPEIFSQILAVDPDFSYVFDGAQNIRWGKLPRIVVWLFRTALGDEGFRLAETPKIYDKPRDLFLYSSMISSLFTGIWIYILRKRFVSLKASSAKG